MLSLERCARLVVDRWENGNLFEAVQALVASLDAIEKDRFEGASVIAAAKAQFAGETEIEIDEEPHVSLSTEGEGAWVQAWVWIPTS